MKIKNGRKFDFQPDEIYFIASQTGDQNEEHVPGEERSQETNKTFENGSSTDKNLRAQEDKCLSALPRSSGSTKLLNSRRRTIKMIGVVVFEFFICWTPIYILNVVALFYPKLVYGVLGMKGVAFMHLLSYCSTFCNPVTYCFMSKHFRRAFLDAIRCEKERASFASENMC